ncbi:MAG: TetR/AcrR family transcriptional regulator [Phycisphaerae bacterium]|nr:TetR/AcrR family transcriptional regulator [Phycisphaerae bacterium]
MTRLPAAKRREQLLDTAVALFAEKGYGGATTAELAKAAGVTEPIIYRHFESKKTLFIAAIERTGEMVTQTWERQMRTAHDPAHRLRRLIGANPMVMERGRGFYRVIVQAMMEIADPDILAAIQEHIISLHRFVAREVALAQDEGHVSKYYSPEITAWTLLHLGLGYGMMEPLGIKGHAEDERGVRVRDLIERLMLGDKARTTGERAERSVHHDD